MIKRITLLTILTLFLYMSTSGATHSDTSANTKRSPYDEGYPPWWYRNGTKVWDWGFPVYDQVKLVPSLAPQQREEIYVHWLPYLRMHHLLIQQISALRNKLKIDPDNSNLKQRIRELNSQIVKNAYDAWVDAKPRLTPKQLQEVRQIALDHAPKFNKTISAPQAAPNTQTNTNVHNYQW